MMWVILALSVLYALTTRMIGFFQPYHHDEYKWVMAADPSYNLEDSIPHPFLARFLYEEIGALIGYDNLRLVPILLSLATLTLLFFIVRRWFKLPAAVFSVAVYTITLYALLGSLQIDIDGAFLPLATLVAFGGYLLFRDGEGREKQKGFLILLPSLLVGFALKLSFILTPAAIIADYLFRNRAVLLLLLRSRLVYIGGILMLFLGGATLFFFGEEIQFLRYVRNFTSLEGRAYFQLVFETAKALMYLSPLLVGGVVLGWRYRRELSVWYWFLAANAVFYFVLFDFSHRTFDRYLLFFILPASVITGVAISRAVESLPNKKHLFIFGVSATALLAALSHLLFSLPHKILPLIPKSAYIEAVQRGEWSFLVPLTGGSGPLGFYLPFDFVAVLWIMGGISLFFAWSGREKIAPYALLLFLTVSLVYSAFATTEYLLGAYFGSAPKVIRTLITNIESRDLEKRVITYNDIAAYELSERNLYEARFYPHPEFIESNRKKFEGVTPYFLVVEIPELNTDSVYGRFFSQCKVLHEVRDKRITGSFYDCGGVSFSSLLP